MKEIQHIALDILKEVTAICEINGYRYSLAFGTLIGAIRHKGFIPWDDDIDIMMPRPDYDRLLTYLDEHPIENLKVFYWKRVPNYIYGITRICDMRYKIDEEGKIDCGMGVFIDVYPLDGLSDDYNEAKEVIRQTEYYRDCLCSLSLKNELKWYISKHPLIELRHIKRNLIRRFHGLAYYQNKLEEKARMRSFDKFKYVGVANWNWTRCVFKGSWFDNLIKLKFEDSEFYVVAAYDEMLREEYGDYMQLPPIEKRVYHHCYKAYKV